MQVLEKSGFLNEVGAAIHVAPNATRILKRWGCNLDWLNPVHCEKLQIWDANGRLLSTPIVSWLTIDLEMKRLILAGHQGVPENLECI